MIVPDQQSPPLAIARNGPVVTLTLQRPERHNAFDDHLLASLQAAFDDLGTDADVHVVILAAQGRTFSAGADLNWMRRAAAYTEEENRRDALALATMLRTAASLPRPLIARVQGPALGGGMGLVAVADIAIAAARARFGFSEARLGLIPATIAPHGRREDRPRPRPARSSSLPSGSRPTVLGRSVFSTASSPTTNSMML